MGSLIGKRRTVHDLYHEACKSFVSGNGSMAFPYTCPCGIWALDTTNYQYVLQESSTNNTKED